MYIEVFVSILSAVLRTAAAYILLLVLMRLMGRKAMSQMTFFDFCISITAGAVSANVCLAGDTSFRSGAAVLVTLAVFGILTGYVHIKSIHFRKLVNSEPLILIDNGEIVKSNLIKSRVALTELTSLLREKNVFNIADVHTAILESDGKLSVLLKSDRTPIVPADIQLHPPEKGLTKDLIIDGELLEENLASTQLTKAWVLAELKGEGIEDIREVFFAALDSAGKLYVSRGKKGIEKSGQHGIE